jgi:hypothetical protein
MYGTSWQVLAQANGLHNPNVIRAGNALCIPTGYPAYSAPTYGYKPHKYYSQPMSKPHKHYPPKHTMPGYGAPMQPPPMYPAPTFPGY